MVTVRNERSSSTKVAFIGNRPGRGAAKDNLVLDGRKPITLAAVDILVGYSHPEAVERRERRTNIGFVGPASQINRVLVGVLHMWLLPQPAIYQKRWSHRIEARADCSAYVPMKA
jgi:hypothetical protein